MAYRRISGRKSLPKLSSGNWKGKPVTPARSSRRCRCAARWNRPRNAWSEELPRSFWICCLQEALHYSELDDRKGKLALPYGSRGDHSGHFAAKLPAARPSKPQTKAPAGLRKRDSTCGSHSPRRQQFHAPINSAMSDVLSSPVRGNRLFQVGDIIDAARRSA